MSYSSNSLRRRRRNARYSKAAVNAVTFVLVGINFAGLSFIGAALFTAAWLNLR